jgi:hypothetical protein
MTVTPYVIPCRLIAIEPRKIAVMAKKDEDGQAVFEYEPNGWWATVEFDKTRVSFCLGDTEPTTPLTITLDPNR